MVLAKVLMEGYEEFDSVVHRAMAVLKLIGNEEYSAKGLKMKLKQLVSVLGS